jgi:hypothetical protein
MEKKAANAYSRPGEAKLPVDSDGLGLLGTHDCVTVHQSYRAITLRANGVPNRRWAVSVIERAKDWKLTTLKSTTCWPCARRTLAHDA